MNKLAALCCVSFIALTGCVSTASNVDVAPGERPDVTTTEAGLWMQMDKFEAQLARSELTVFDPELNDYLHGLICNIAPEHCGGIRVYIQKYPQFNATMAPNGAMFVWVGLLLRVENEAQLVTVLGHEFAHYAKRHSLKKFESTKALTDFMTLFSIGTGLGGVGIVGVAASYSAMGGIQAYSRELETEADRVGQAMMVKGGYSPFEAAKLWQLVIEEQNRTEHVKGSLFLATHPPSQSRVDNLTLWAKDYPKPTSDLTVSNDRLIELVQARWPGWVEELITSRSFDRSLYVLERLEQRGFDAGYLNFFRGEIFRRRSEEGDVELARVHYLLAANENNPPDKTYKKLGLLEKKEGNAPLALEYLEKYLIQNPQAADKALVDSYIENLR